MEPKTHHQILSKDIVERLRDYYDPNELLDEAADEIERLRVICEHWEVKYARMKYDYLEMIQTGKLPEFVTTEMGRSVLNDREKGETLGQERGIKEPDYS